MEIRGVITLKPGTLLLLPLKNFALSFHVLLAFGMALDMLSNVPMESSVNQVEELVHAVTMAAILEHCFLIDTFDEFII